MSGIVGIVLVRNEDRFVARAVRNAMAFCDRMLLVDHGSADGTPAILRKLAAESGGRAGFHAIGHPRESHDLLQPFVGTPTWVFGVDGDEIYDPERLAGFRSELLGGAFDRHWMVMGNVLHCERLGGGEAAGYLAPPSRSITKLYNFSAITSWSGDTPERLHGGHPVFRAGYEEASKRLLQEEFAWEESPLRCLHACFVSRSSLDAHADSRENIMETYCGGWTNRLRRLWRRLRGEPEVSHWKRERYARGELVTLPTGPFFPENL